METGATKATVKAVALISGATSVKGSLHFVQGPNGVTHVKGKITGLKPGLHGFHIHALGDTTNGCNSTGPHFNPLKKDHGAPSDNERHTGDLGNIVAGPDGINCFIPLSGQHSILGRAVVVHADPDDLGKGKFSSLSLILITNLFYYKDTAYWYKCTQKYVYFKLSVLLENNMSG
ncbi:Superoxide dismutase (Cu-Zn) 3 [Citrus sinensis]|nr:Superoxide dismutase (Cu-Zn) 3 [Citrus sinensis]